MPPSPPKKTGANPAKKAPDAALDVTKAKTSRDAGQTSTRAKGEVSSRGQTSSRKPKDSKSGAKTAKAGGRKNSTLEGISEDSKPTATPVGDSKPKDDTPTTVYIGDKKIEYLSKELLGRRPLEEKARSALLKKCGPAKQEINFERNENHRPVGRADGLTPSRHERVPPSQIVLMFNCFEASFTLLAGDITTMPESDTLDLRSLTSGKVLGRIKITPEKGEDASWGILGCHC